MKLLSILTLSASAALALTACNPNSPDRAGSADRTQTLDDNSADVRSGAAGRDGQPRPMASPSQRPGSVDTTTQSDQNTTSTNQQTHNAGEAAGGSASGTTGSGAGTTQGTAGGSGGGTY